MNERLLKAIVPVLIDEDPTKALRTNIYEASIKEMLVYKQFWKSSAEASGPERWAETPLLRHLLLLLKHGCVVGGCCPSGAPLRAASVSCV